MAIEVINRVENKYLISTDTCHHLLKTLETRLVPDAYNRDRAFYTIANIYYDTEDSHLIRTSLSKPNYKEKLRLRAYGVPAAADTVYLEIKKKCGGVVNKRRISLPLPSAYSFVQNHCIPPANTNQQIAEELAYALKRYAPLPAAYIAYERRAFSGENGLRITIDTNIRTRRCDLALEKGDYGDPLLASDTWLMETKINGALPLWVARLFSEHGVYPTSFSKYGTEYRKFLNLSQGGEVNCLRQSLTQVSSPAALLQLPSHGKVQLSPCS